MLRTVRHLVVADPKSTARHLGSSAQRVSSSRQSIHDAARHFESTARAVVIAPGVCSGRSPCAKVMFSAHTPGSWLCLQTRNATCLDGSSVPYREIPTNEGTLPSQQFPAIPPLTTKRAIASLTAPQCDILLRSWGLPVAHRVAERRVDILAQVGAQRLCLGSCFSLVRVLKRRKGTSS